jgi:hypothetical protein
MSSAWLANIPAAELDRRSPLGQEVARLAIACWARFGGHLTVSPEIAQMIPAGDRPDDMGYLAPGDVPGRAR